MASSINLSQDATSEALVIDGRPQAGQLQAEHRRPHSLQAHADPYPQALDSQPDLVVISYPQVPADGKPDIAEMTFSVQQLQPPPPMCRWGS